MDLINLLLFLKAKKGGGSSNVPQPMYSGYVITRKGNSNGTSGMMAGAWVESWNMTSTGARDFWNSSWNSPSKIWFKNGITTLGDFVCANCGNLTYVYLANTITSISPNCFGSSKTASQTAAGNDNLITIEVEPGFHTDLWLASQGAYGQLAGYIGPTGLSREVIRAIIDNYADNSGCTLTLGPETY